MYALFPKDAPIVQKYGGTSVGDGTRIRNVAARVARQHAAGYKRIAIVVSARAGETNRLVDMMHEVNPKASGPAYDMALAAGEQVAVALMTAALETQGLSARPLLAHQLGIRTDDLHAKARIRSIDTAMIREAWDRNAVVVVAGFQGISPDNEITTLGRGGSDTSAVALAVALGAAFCEINTDVDGVFSADPRVVADARFIGRIDYETALEMASLGSKVLHPRCVELGAKFRIPIVVRNTFTPDDHRRTCIMPQTDSDVIEALAVSSIALERNVARVTLSGLGDDSGAIAAVFDKLGKLGINVDVIVHDRASDVTQGARLGFTVARGDLAAAVSAIETLAVERSPSLRVSTDEGLAKVSAVGVGMRSYAGVAGRTFSALSRAGIEIRMISTSEIKISVIVAEADGDKATRALHDEFVK